MTKGERNYYIDVVLFITALACMISGILLDLRPRWLAIPIWFKPMHTYTGYVLVALVLVHLAVHGGWIGNVSRGIFREKGKVLFLALVIAIKLMGKGISSVPEGGGRIFGKMGGTKVLGLRRRKSAMGVSLLLMLLLGAAAIAGGCGSDNTVFKGDGTPGEHLVVYERDGYVWQVKASGDGARRIGETGNLRLGPPAPDGRKLAVLTGVRQSGEWLSGYAGVLNLNGRLKPVVGPRGALTQEPGEMAWVGDSLVLACLDGIWVATEDGSVFRAKAVYTVKSELNERVWYPRAVPGGKEISFWITSNEGEESRVRARLVTLPLGGGKPRTVFSGTVWAGGNAPVDVLWSQNGRYALIYCEPADGGSCWWLLDGEAGTARAVLSPEAGDPQWLPGSETEIVYAPRAALQVPGYEVLDLVTGKKRSFTRIPNWVTWLEVSPDGKMLLLARVTEADVLKYDLYTAAADGTGLKRIASGAGDAFWQH